MPLTPAVAGGGGGVHERMEAGGLAVDEPVSDLPARQFHIIFSPVRPDGIS